MRTLSQLASLALLAGALALIPGCLVNSSSRTEYSGRYISADTVKQIEPGKSKSDFVVAVLGDPSSKNKLDDGSEVWKWEYQKKHSSSGQVFLLVNSNDHTESQGATYVVMRDGVVERVWQD